MTPSSTTGSIRLTVCGRSHRGQVRTSNQDNFLVADLTRGTPETVAPEADDGLAIGPAEFALGSAGAILMVADGMGGRAGGEKASATAVDFVTAAMASRSGNGTASAFVQGMRDALMGANAAIHAEGQSSDSLRGMGTTATLAGLLGTTVYVAQVGDSRAYLSGGGSISRLTRDQSLVQDLIDMGVLSQEDAKNVPSNQILQALGAAATVEPVLTYHELRRGDVLLLCSDGLSGVVTDDEVDAAIADSPDCRALCDRLVDLANARGGPDNITVLAMRLEGEPLRLPDENEVVQPRSYPKNGT